VFDSFRQRVVALRRSNDLFFAALLSAESIASAFGDATAVLDSARTYNTAVTVWTLLSQVFSADHSCRSAVARLIAFRAAKRLRSPSAGTGAYCIARDKLEEQAMHRLVKHNGSQAEQTAPDSWLWLGHRVVVADGTTVTMPDTAANQREYPQQTAQKPGCGTPIMRVVVLFSLATGAALDAAMGPYKGKKTSEVDLFRQIDGIIGPDDVFLADRFYSGWFDLARLMMRGGHVVVRKHQRRKTDFRTGPRFGKDDHAVFWDRPARPKWMSPEEYDTYVSHITLREIRHHVETPGFRSRVILVVTSLLDDTEYSKEDLAALYRRRWQAELNLRSLKMVMQMDHLRCKQPHRVRNELRAHLTGYNLIRQLMCEAAAHGEVQPWRISFKATLQTCNELLPQLAVIQPAEFCNLLFTFCLSHTTGNRPGRYEPRVKKRRPKGYKLLNTPRSQYQPGEAK